MTLLKPDIPLAGPSPRGARGDGCIVCGTDFSARSAEAANAALAVAMRLKQPLVLVHSMAETFREELPAGARDSLIPLIQERLCAEAERLRALGASVETRVLRGLPDDGMAAFERGCGAGLLIVGKTEHEMVARCLTGNVAEVLAESSPVPTLVVHSAAPFAEWARGGRSLRVLVAADLVRESGAVIRWVNELRRIAPCDATVAHVIRGPGEGERDLIEAEMKESVGALWGGENTAIRVLLGTVRVHHRIIAAAREARADLLVIGTHQRHGVERWLHPSVSRAVLRHSPLSVVCVPSSVEAAPPVPAEFVF